MILQFFTALIDGYRLLLTSSRIENVPWLIAADSCGALADSEPVLVYRVLAS